MEINILEISEVIYKQIKKLEPLQAKIVIKIVENLCEMSSEDLYIPGTNDWISQHTELESVELKDMSAKDIIWEILSWTNNGHPRKTEVPSALHFDKETKTILIDKDLLMVAIQIISPYQENRDIKLMPRDEIKKWLTPQ